MSEPFRYFLRVRYGECDAQHVVYNPRYGEYIDLAATEYIRAAFVPENPFNGAFEFQVVKLLVEWKSPALFDDILEISVQPARFGNTSFTLAYEIRRAGAPAVIVTGETVNVHATRINDTWSKSPLPPAIRAKLETVPRGKVVNHAGNLPR